MSVLDRLKSEKHKQIARLIQEGNTNKQIAEKMGWTEQSTKNAVTKIYDLVGCSNRLELAIWLTQEQLGERRRPA